MVQTAKRSGKSVCRDEKCNNNEYKETRKLVFFLLNKSKVLEEIIEIRNAVKWVELTVLAANGLCVARVWAVKDFV